MKLLIKEICKREGKKSPTSVGNVREVVKCLMNILAEAVDADNHAIGEPTNKMVEEFESTLRAKIEKLKKKRAK